MENSSPRGRFFELLESFGNDIPRISTNFITHDGIDFKKLGSQLTRLSFKSLIPVLTTGSELLLTLWEDKPKDSLSIQAVSSLRNSIALYSVLDNIYSNIIPSSSIEYRGDIMFWKDTANQFKIDIPLCNNYSTSASGIIPLSDILIYLVSKMKDGEVVEFPMDDYDAFTSKVTVERIGYIGADPIINADGSVTAEGNATALLRCKAYTQNNRVDEDVYYALTMTKRKESGNGDDVPVTVNIGTMSSYISPIILQEHAAYITGYPDSMHKTVECALMAIYRRLDATKFHFFVQPGCVMVKNNSELATGDEECWVESPDLEKLHSECQRASELNMKRSYALVGPPGTGKTGMCERLMMNMCKDGYTVIRCMMDPRAFSSLLGTIRKVIHMTPKCVILFDDLDKLDIKSKHSENVGSLIDFFASVKHCDVPTITFSTVNNPKNVNSTIMGRPERIDEIIYIKPPCKEMTMELLRKYGARNGFTIDDEVLDTVSDEIVEMNASVADIKNLCATMRVKHPKKDMYDYNDFKVGIEAMASTRDVARMNFCIDGDED